MPDSRNRWLIVAYAAAIFVSAFLLFQIQPLVSKRILPWFGGSPTVWTTCLLFFQSALFAGYAYAHATINWVKPRQQAVVHIALLVLALIFSRALPGDQWEPTGTEQPISQILLILAVSVGIPYFVLSATGPLLQAWFARSIPGRVPYRLYALSNVGSLLALLSYPLFFEPTFNLTVQGQLWTAGFVFFAALCACIAWRTGLNGEAVGPLSTNEPAPTQTSKNKHEKKQSAVRAAVADSPKVDARPHPARYVVWLALSAFASLVLIATTSHISTDIAGVPLIWVVPLALYLLTFIIAFDRPSWYRPTPYAVVAILAIYASALTHHVRLGDVHLLRLGTPGLLLSYLYDPSLPNPIVRIVALHFFVANLVALFAICMICHGELVKTRPAPRYLTSFYLMISAGGALGGIFAALIAPLIFTSYVEWDISMVIACLASLIIIVRAVVSLVNRDRGHETRPSRYAILAAVTLAVILPSAVMMVDLNEFLFNWGRNVRWRARNFFGALTVQERDEAPRSPRRLILVHGSITHGSQLADPALHREATTYYARNSGVGRVIDYYHKHVPAGQLRIGAVGLGAGTLAVYPDAGDSITFYEINPIDIDLAEHSPYFTFLRDCRDRGANCEIHRGDARLTLERELAAADSVSFSSSAPSGPSPRSGEALGEGFPGSKGLPPYNVLVLDAFSGDSIPVHLLTAQAFEIYLKCLVRGTTNDGKSIEAGAIAIHVSNRFLNLDPVVQALATRFDMYLVKIHNPDDPTTDIYESEWIIVTRNRNLADDLVKYASAMDGARRPVLWTDDRSSLYEIFR